MAAREEAMEAILLGMERAMEFVVVVGVGSRELVRAVEIAVVGIAVVEGTPTVVLGSSARISCVALEMEFFLR